MAMSGIVNIGGSVYAIGMSAIFTVMGVMFLGIGILSDNIFSLGVSYVVCGMLLWVAVEMFCRAVTRVDK